MYQYAGDLNQSISKTMQSEDVKSNGRKSKYECFLQALSFLNTKGKQDKPGKVQSFKPTNFFQFVKSQSQIPEIKPIRQNMPNPIQYPYDVQYSLENDESEFSRTMVHCSREEEFVYIFIVIIIGKVL